MRQASRRTTNGQRLSQVPDDRPFVLIESGTHGLTIAAVNDRARAEGLVIGQALADARAAFPDLLTAAAEPDHDRKRLKALAHGAGRYGPARNVEGDDGLWIDITGVAHLFDGERALGRDLVRRLGAAGFRARAGIADTPSAAFALARFGTGGGSAENHIAIADPMTTHEALSRLPVDAMRLDMQTIILLRRLGLRRIGQLYDIPRTVLARRFRDLKGKGAKGLGRASEREGLAQAVVMRLDQALGRLGDPRVPLLEPAAYVVRRSYPDMLITADGIETACHALAAALCQLLAAAHKGARRLRFSLYRADGSVADAVIGTSQPCRTPEHLLELFRDKLNALDVGFGVDMITLEAMQVEVLRETQSRLATQDGKGSMDHWQATSALVDRLINRLGRQDVFRLSGVASHIPEQAQRRDRKFASAPAEFEKTHDNRPPFLISPPEPITVIAEVPEGPPARFVWRRATHHIVKAQGPERIAPEWWHTDPAKAARDFQRVRDYYTLEDKSGARYWVFRAGLYQHEAVDGAPAWYMHGLFG